MTPMGALKLRRARVAYGLETGRDKQPPPPADLALAERELQSWNPVPIAALGGIGLLVVVYLMVVKPF
jgi:hypothetical protein